MVVLDGEAVIYDGSSGDLHHLNPTATVVFSLCDGTASAHDLAVEIAEAFDQPVDEVERQVRRLVRQLREQELVVTDRATASAEGRAGG